MTTRSETWKLWLRLRPKSVMRFYRPRIEVLEDRTTPAVSGSLDPIFGVGGLAYAQFNGAAQSYGIFRDLDTNAIYTVGYTNNSLTGDDIAVVRYNSDGSRDLSFGTNGQVVTSLGTGASNERAFAVSGGTDSSGNFRLVVAGSSFDGTKDKLFIVRYDDHGAVDTSFNGGSLLTDFGSNGSAKGYRVLFDASTGKTLVAGQVQAGSGTAMVLARYDFGGSLDETFNGGAGVFTAQIGSNDSITGLDLDSSGNIFVAGTTQDAVGSDIFVASFDANGNLNTSTFGSAGFVKINIGAQDSATSLQIDRFDRIVVGGNTQVGTDSDFVVARLDSSGTLDFYFGASGVAVPPLGNGQDDHLNDIAIDANNLVIAVGTTFGPSTDNSTATVAVRLDDFGNFDGSFGSGGIAITNLLTAPSPSSDHARGATLDANGNILITGSTFYNAQDVFDLLSLVPSSNSPTPSFDAVGDAYTISSGQTFDILTSGQLGILANDVLNYDQSFTVNFDTTGILGTIVTRDDGSFVYLPPSATFAGTDSFTYVVFYDNGSTLFTSKSTTVTITIAGPANSPPVLVSTAQNLTTIAEDANGNTIAGNAVSTLIPSSIYSDADSGDAKGIAVTDFDNTNGVWQYKVDAASAWTDISPLFSGSALHLYSSAYLRFIPSADYNGSAAIMYVGWDRTNISGDVDNGVIAPYSIEAPDSAYSKNSNAGVVVVTPVNDSPVGVQNQYLGSIDEDSGDFTILWTSLIDFYATPGPANESGQTLSISEVSNVVGGTARIVGDTVVFSPTANYFGPASFDFTVSDNGVTGRFSDPRSVTARADFYIFGTNDPPSGTNDVLSSVAEDSGPRVITIESLMANDLSGPNEQDMLSFVGISAPVGGTIQLVGGSVVFTPTPDFNGVAGFSYTIQDTAEGRGGVQHLQSTFLARFQITEVNDAPSVPDLPLSPFDAAFGSLLVSASTLLQGASKGPANESGQTLSIASVFNIVGGTVSLVGGGIVFTPTDGFNGTASFNVVISDNGTTNGQAAAKSSTVTVSFEVTGTALPPAAMSPSTNTGGSGAGVPLYRDPLFGSFDNSAPTNQNGSSNSSGSNSEFDEFQKSIRLIAPPSPATALAYARAWGNYEARVAVVTQVLQQTPGQRPTTASLGLADSLSNAPQTGTRMRILGMVSTQLETEDNVSIFEHFLNNRPAGGNVRPVGIQPPAGPAPGLPAPPAPPEEQSSILESVQEYGMGLMLFMGLVANVALQPFADKTLFAAPPRRRTRKS
jgi:uncharacterized delta-60 repeat protein